MTHLKTILVFVLGVGVVLVAYGLINLNENTDIVRETVVTDDTDEENTTPIGGGLTINPIEHASGVLKTNNTIIYMDPVGDPALYEALETPDVVLITDIHGDHLNIETLEAVIGADTEIVVPQAVYDELTLTLRSQASILNNGETIQLSGYSIEAIPMYNLPESSDSPHVKGRGNGYVVEGNGRRIYIAGDTEGIPEMRALENIAVAFVPMNLPYTMSVEDAADAVLAFAPEEVYPYHYRGQDGLSDVERFKELVNEENADIEVVLLDWYPRQE